jgi:alkylation response protein AidB-like acyl-CoA dehydrogenase
MTPDPVALARDISDGFLFPGALEVDASDIVPIDRLDRLADAGFYGLAGPADAGGMGLDDPRKAFEIIEILASGCLTTTFVWIQHHGAVRAALPRDRQGGRGLFRAPPTRPADPHRRARR